MYSTIEDTFYLLDKIPTGSLLEFGVFSGNTLNRLIKGAEGAGKPFTHVIGFDSFIGIPKETEGVLHNPEWPEGAFNVCHDFKLSGPDEAMEFVRSRVERKDIQLVSGYYEDSLGWALAGFIRDSASYLHIDVDLYSSTIEVLNWLLKHQIPKIGSIWRYDDWLWCREGEAGNSLAHQQMVQKYHVVFNRLSLNVYQLVSY